MLIRPHIDHILAMNRNGGDDVMLWFVVPLLFVWTGRHNWEKKLVLLFDEDFTRLRMTIDDDDDDDDDDDSGGGGNNDATVFPKEQIIVQLWKKQPKIFEKR